MKTETTLLKQISNQQLQQLTVQVKETLATETNHPNAKNIFSSADLWKIQQSKRVRTTRRFFA
jgi:uracil DNA glycosylase